MLQQHHPEDRTPTYSGEEPEVTFRSFEKSVKLWEFETDVPPVKRGAKLLRSLAGPAKLAVEEMSFEEITSEKGVENIMDRLRDYFLPHLEVSLPRAFEAAVYGASRTSKEGFNEYLARMDKAFHRLRKEGVDLPDGAEGYILYRQSNLNESQDQRFLVWADGKYDRRSVIHALRKLDKVVKEKSKGHYVSEVDSENMEAFLTEDPYGMIAEDDDENYVYLQEGDLDNILEEDDVIAAMASYQEIRKAVKDQQKGRGYYKGFGKKGFGKAEGKGQRVHKEQVKLRTRCWKCGQVGHLSRECRSESNAHKNQTAASVSASSISTAKSGFFVASDVAAGKNTSQFWLKEFVEDRAKTNSAPHGAYKSDAAQFCGICTSAEQGIVDTAAEGGLVGSVAFGRIQGELEKKGLKMMWTSKKTSARGVGGQASVLGVAMLPLGIGGVNGLLETTVVNGDVPLLFPIRMMTALHTVIDLCNMKFIMKLYDVTIDMKSLASGHVAIDVMQFATEGFKVPEGASGFCQEDFQFFPRHDRHGDAYAMVAMVAQLATECNSNPKVQNLASSGPHGIFAGAREAAWERRCSFRSGICDADGRGAAGSSPKESLEGMAYHPRQDDHSDRLLKHAASRGRVVSSIATLAVLLLGATGGDHGGCVCGNDCGNQAFGTAEDQRSTKSFSKHMHTPEVQAEGRRQPDSLLYHLPRLQQSLGECIPSGATQEGHEAKQEREEGPLGSTAGDGSYGGSGSHPNGHGREHEVDAATGVGEDPKSGDAAAIAERADGAEECHQRGGNQNGGQDESYHSGVRGEECPEEAATGSTTHELTGSGGPLRMQATSREVDCEEGRSQERQGIFQVHAERMSVLPLGEEGGRIQCGQLECGEFRGGILQEFLSANTAKGQSATELHQEPQASRSSTSKEEVQKPEETDGSDSRTGSGGGLRLGGEYGWGEAQSRRGRRSLRRMQQAHHSNTTNNIFTAEDGYEVQEEGAWSFRQGRVPLNEERPTRVKLHPSNRMMNESGWDNGREIQFNRKQRKKLQQDMEVMFQKAGGVHINEVFSPPRVTKLAKHSGMKAGEAYDILTGWDLSDPTQRGAFWKKLKEEDPMVS